MTSTLRCLSLLGSLLSVAACSERAAPSTSAPAAPALAPAPTPDPAPDLTSTLPPKPADLTAAKPSLTPPAPQLPAEADPPHDEPAIAPEVAYDRPLDPAEVKLERFVLTTNVVGREPVDQAEVFYTDTDKIFAFVHLANDDDPYSVKVHWEPADGPPSPYGVALTVPTAPRHRTWAFTRIKRAPGRYHAVLRTLEGQEIARREFFIEAAD